MHDPLHFRTQFFHGRQPAQGLVEYGLIIALIAVVAIAGLIVLGPAIAGLLSGLAASI